MNIEDYPQRESMSGPRRFSWDAKKYKGPASVDRLLQKGPRLMKIEVNVEEEQKDREEFEAWAVSPPFEFCLSRHVNDY